MKEKERIKKNQKGFETKLKQIKDNLTNVENLTSEQQQDLITVKQFLINFDKNIEKQKTVAIGKTEFNCILGIELKLNAFENWR